MAGAYACGVLSEARHDERTRSFHRLHLDTVGRKDRATYLPHERFETWFRTLHRQGLAESLHARGYRGVNLTDASLNAVTKFNGQLGGDVVMSLELDAPRSLRFGFVQLGQQVFHRLLAGAASTARRVFRRS